MGSNGIRFSITDLSPPTARILPTLYTDRAPISLYDAQYDHTGARIPIPASTISAVLTALLAFKRTCADYSVPASHISILATEATRTALNSVAYREAIQDATGWAVTLLAKEDEGRTGAMGVASSLESVHGLMMDLGGGSTQLTWLLRDADGGIAMPAAGAVSLPFGAAALTKRLEACDSSKGEGEGRAAFAADLQAQLRTAYASLAVPAQLEEAAEREEGFTLYLSGGGFRGWGFILLSQHAVQPYPIPVINGFRAPTSAFLATEGVEMAAEMSLDEQTAEAIFRVSQRRASQVPAVAFLVTALSKALPRVKEVRFCQGGVREGYLFASLPREVQAQSPLEVATRPYAPHPESAARIYDVFCAALPAAKSGHGGRAAEYNAREFLSDAVRKALANLLTTHSTHPKDLRAASALRSTTTGLLAPVHGLAHEDRAALALLLCERWGGEKALPPADVPFFQSLQALFGPWERWWIGYLGRVAGLVGAVAPAGRLEEGEVEVVAGWGRGKKGERVEVRVGFGEVGAEEVFRGEVEKVEKVGKRKNWVGGREGAGWRVEVEVGVGVGRVA
ncbi:retrograde regulation protein 2 [Zalaria obscura]|uniref:Retrograde regulation protein 2 n=1 Tax=Zalaria obscura TaxID=2024903 RepID=A0ACC3SBY6_9PEZI